MCRSLLDLGVSGIAVPPFPSFHAPDGLLKVTESALFLKFYVLDLIENGVKICMFRRSVFCNHKHE